MLQISLVVAVFVVGLYVCVYLRDRKLVEDQVLISARAHFQDMVLTRMWNAMYGGVYVEKKEGVESSPYLDDPEISARDGRVFTLRNPAMMMREISELSDLHGVVQYRITSLKPFNPDNEPDDFQVEALRSFEQGAKEAFREVEVDGRTFFRYMAPLATTESCLKCHAEQGYSIGDVRGGISVTFNISSVKEAMAINQGLIILLIFCSTGLVVGVFLLFAMRLMRQLQTAQEKIATLAVTDELTGLANRRHFFERMQEELDRAVRYDTNLSMIMLDIDHFKVVNDTHGHPVGDIVLKEIARLLAANIRTSDIIGRYGGEEFVILIPTLGMDDAARVAEKLRNVIEVNDITFEGPALSVTVSAGVADLDTVRDEEGSLKDNLLRSADKALYAAKLNGRNRVEKYHGDRERQFSLL